MCAKCISNLRILEQEICNNIKLKIEKRLGRPIEEGETFKPTDGDLNLLHRIAQIEECIRNRPRLAWSKK